MAASKRPGFVFSPAKLRDIWAKTTIDGWLAILNEFLPGNRWEARGAVIKGLCPFHDDHAPSFFINLDRGTYRCFGASCQKYGWNPIHLYADVAKTSYADALRQMKNRFGFKLPAAYVQQAQQFEDHNNLKLALLRVMNSELVDALNNPSAPEFQYIKDAGTLPWVSERQFPGLLDKQGVATEGAVHLWPVGILPTKQRLFDLLSDPKGAKFQQPAYEYLQFVLENTKYPGSLVFFYFTTPTTVGRIRIRTPRTKEFYVPEDKLQEGEFMGYFGFNLVSYLQGGQGSSEGSSGQNPAYRVATTEGEFDMLSVMSHQLADGTSDILLLATAGSGVPSLEPLRAFGIEDVSAIPDKDIGGEGWAMGLMRDGNVREIFSWTKEEVSVPQFKDIDGAVRYYGYEKIRARLIDDQAYYHNHEWLQLRAAERIALIPNDDVRRRTELAANLGANLPNAAERKSYVSAISSQFGLNPDLVMRSIPLEINTDEDLVARLIGRLGEEYYVMYGTGGSNQQIRLWNKKKRVAHDLDFSSTSRLRSLLQGDLGPLVEFIKDEFGMPPFLEYRTDGKGNASPVPYPQKLNHIVTLFLEGMASLVQSAPPKTAMTMLGNGVHYIPDFERGQPAVIIVNGNKFYKGTIFDKTVRYEELECPAAGPYLFQTGSPPWSACLNSLEDLKPLKGYDIRRTYEKLVRVFSEAWRFKDHEVDAKYLAAEVIYTTVASAFEFMTIVEVTGDSTSGKTKLMQFLGGVKEAQDLRILEACDYHDNYTAYAFTRMAGGKSIRYLLDEFEIAEESLSGKPNARATRCQDVLSILRQMHTGSVMTRGTGTGDYTRNEVHVPVMIAGVYTSQATVDVTRFVRVRTVKQDCWEDPYVRIRKILTSEGAAQLRRDITLGLLSQIPVVVDTYKQIKDEFNSNPDLLPGIDTRLCGLLFPSTTIMKMAGDDYVGFLQKMTKAKMSQMVDLGVKKKEHENLWTQVLFSPVSLQTHSGGSHTGVFSIAKIIGDSATWDILDQTDLGVHYLPDRKWLVVFWPRALPMLLSNTSFRTVSNSGRLKTIADLDPRVIPKNELERIKFLSTAQRLIGAREGYESFSVFDVRDILLPNSSTLDEGAPVVKPSDGVRKLTDDLPNSPLHRGNFDEVIGNATGKGK